MNAGVLIYCFDTPQVKYHKLAERCVQQVKTKLKLPITIITDIDTFKKFSPMGMINYKIVEPSTTNTRAYRGNNIAWYNKERVLAFEHSPYDKTILMDCDYFVFSDKLLELLNTQFDVLLHDKVSDMTGLDSISGDQESTLPLVWATVTLFAKTEQAKKVFELIKHIQKNYVHYMNLYRIKYTNYRNDFAFAIALHQMGINQRIPTPMSMLSDNALIIESDQQGVMFKQGDTVNIVNQQDIHIMDKEWCNG